MVLALGTALLALGCGYRVRVGEHDAGSPGACVSNADCGLGNQCACGRCISLDLPAPACNPPCQDATHGDWCDDEGATCARPDCTVATCSAGIWRIGTGACDGGVCGCPTPPPEGCHYVGCSCDDLVCDPQSCGRSVCAPGTTCCNASCGLCVAPGGGCSELECPPDCSPMDAFGYGACALTWGYAWNGRDCLAVGGCECVGSECGALFPSVDTCEAFFSRCERPCGTIAGLVCDPDEWCDYDSEAWCGAGDFGGICRPRPTTCSGVVDEVCGCDTATYTNDCFASLAGTDVAHRGACGDCDPDDAASIGLCDSVFGYAWTSSGCVVVSCACEGADCEAIAGSDRASCERAHTECVVPLRLPR